MAVSTKHGTNVNMMVARPFRHKSGKSRDNPARSIIRDTAPAFRTRLVEGLIPPISPTLPRMKPTHNGPQRDGILMASQSDPTSNDATSNNVIYGNMMRDARARQGGLVWCRRMFIGWRGSCLMRREQTRVCRPGCAQRVDVASVGIGVFLRAPGTHSRSAGFPSRGTSPR